MHLQAPISHSVPVSDLQPTLSLLPTKRPVTSSKLSSLTHQPPNPSLSKPRADRAARAEAWPPQPMLHRHQGRWAREKRPTAQLGAETCLLPPSRWPHPGCPYNRMRQGRQTLAARAQQKPPALVPSGPANIVPRAWCFPRQLKAAQRVTNGHEKHSAQTLALPPRIGSWAS